MTRAAVYAALMVVSVAGTLFQFPTPFPSATTPN